MLRKSRLRNICVVVLLLSLPLLYFQNVDRIQQYRNFQKYEAQVVMDVEGAKAEGNSPTPAAVRGATVTETSRVQGAARHFENSVFTAREKCQSKLCTEFLTESDKGHFRYCWRMTELKRESERSQCKFLNITSRAPVALASFPGSGNTWVRGLLQQATGVCTGGIYCDTELRVSGYPGETIRSGRTLVVKTHQVDPRWTGVTYPPNTTDSYFTIGKNIPVYDSAILIVRNPHPALVSKWNRLVSINMNLTDHHINSVDSKFFGENPEWERFVYTNAVLWQETLVGWLVHNHNHRVLVVKYEDLLTNTDAEVMKMLDFLGYPYSGSRKLRQDYNVFHRRKSNTTPLDHFTVEQVAFVDKVIENTLQILRSHGLLETCDISHYLYHPAH